MYYSASRSYWLLASLNLIITAMIVIQIHKEKILEKMIVIVPILKPAKDDPEISVKTIMKVGVLVSKRFLT